MTSRSSPLLCGGWAQLFAEATDAADGAEAGESAGAGAGAGAGGAGAGAGAGGAGAGGGTGVGALTTETVLDGAGGLAGEGTVVGDGGGEIAETTVAEVSVTLICTPVRSRTDPPGPTIDPPGTVLPSVDCRFIEAAVAAAAPPTRVSPRAPAMP